MPPYINTEFLKTPHLKGHSSSKICAHSIFICYILLLLLLPISSFAQSANFKGYLKELGNVNLSNNLSSIHFNNILHHRLENNFVFNSGFEVQLDLRNRLLNGYSVQNSPDYAKSLDQDPGFVDMSWLLINTDNTILNSTIDRFQVSYFNGSWEATLGRQRINWGKTSVWNPNDLFNSYAYLDFDYEERPGTDAFSAQYSWSYASSLQGGYKFGDTFDESVVALMLRSNLGEYDIQLLAGNYYNKILVGAGWAGYVKGASLSGEISYFHTRKDFLNQNGHVTATLGSNYMFPNSTLVSAEVLYNGGYTKNQDPLTALITPPTANNLFISKTDFFLNASHPVSPLLNTSLSIMGSFTRSVFIAIPEISYSLSENIDLTVLAQLLKGTVLKNFVPEPNSFFFRLKWSY